MVDQQHSFAGRLLKKAVSVTLAVTLLLSMVIIGDVFGTTAFAAETKTEGNYTYVVLDDGTAQITKYSGTEKSVTVPASLADVAVSSIGKNAFENNDEIESVTFSEGIRTIGSYAFMECDLLENVSFASSVTKIDAFAFWKCRALQTINIPSTVKTIEEGAFLDCPILSEVKLHEGLEKMGKRFIGGTVVSNIYIPASVTTATESFRESELLDSVTFADGITVIPRDMFEGNNSLRTVEIPETVTTLGIDCFAHMGSLESIVIPDSVTEMGNYIFFQCPKLKNVTIGKGITRIPNSAFTESTGLTEITIPDNVTEIGDYAFKDCSKLENVTLSKNLADAGYYSFERTAVREITLPASLTKGSNMFSSCSKLKTIRYSDGFTAYIEGMFQNTGVDSVVIPENVTELPASVFKGCSKLTSVTLPSTLRTIGNYAFEGCELLDDVTIPKSVKTINTRAFAETKALKNFTLQEGVQTLEGQIFSNSALTSIYIPKTLSSTNSPFAGSNITDVTFSEGIATLNDELFRGANKLTELTIPNTVIKIGNSCFRDTNIEAMVIPDNVKTLGNSTFENCDNLYAVKIRAGIRKLPQWCFYGCEVLQNVIIPETVVDMDSNVFEGSGLAYQRLPQSLHYIPYQAFKDCKNLTGVECSDQLESIGDYAFERCAELTTLKTTVKEVEFNNSTFKDCPKFTDKRFVVFNAANTGIESTGSIGAEHTLVHFTVKYDIRDDWEDDDIKMEKLTLSYPNNIEIVPASFSASGFTFDADRYTGDYKSFSLNGGKTSGELRFSAYLNSSADDSLKNMTANVELRYKGTYFNKPLGEVQFTTAKLSLFAPSTVTEQSVVVSGYSASADKDVTVTISRVKSDGTKDSTVTHTVRPNKYTGKYTSEALRILPEGKVAVNEDVFEIQAECGGVKSDVVRFTYLPGAVKVVKALETVNITKFIAPGKTNLSHSNFSNTYDITGVFTRGSSPVVSLNPSEMLQFRLDLENDENICGLVLMSHRGNDWKFMPLFYDAESDMWIGEGYFGTSSHELTPGQNNIVPGAFNLFYFYGERRDSYKSFFYGDGDDVGAADTASVGKPEDEDIFYYDKDGNPHGTLGDYRETFGDTIKNVFINIVTGDWKGAASDATTGGLKSLWQWGNTDHNFFKLTHGGAYLGPDGLPVLPGDGADMYNRDASKDGKQRNAIDPSGIVYEAVESNRVEGAEATIYMLDEESGEWKEWNAADYEQQNSLLTNSEGAYAWLTDAGKYRVTVSKEGYETQTSEEFDVPPEKLDLNFSLVDKTTHPAASVSAGEEYGVFDLKFSKFMKPDTVTPDTLIIDGLEDVSIVPVYLSEGDEFADSFTVSGRPSKKEVKFTVTDFAQSYSGVSAEASETTVDSGMPEGILGDVNGDGKVDITDVTTIQQHIAEIELPNPDMIKLCGDVNNDGKVDITDATTIQKYIADYVLPYPIGEPV